MVRTFEEFIEEAEFTQQLERGRMHRVPAEIAQEVTVLLEHGHAASGARKQQARHHPGRPTSYDDQVEV